MASLFECEVRFIIEDIQAFEKRLGELEAKLLYPYEFTDYYFKPSREKWNPFEKNLRIREWKTPSNPTIIYFVKLEIVTIDDIQFKRALYPQGKVAMFEGDLKTCTSLLNDLGFELWLTIRKEKACLWDVPKYGFKTATEYIKNLGWSGELEFEGEDVNKAKKQIENALEILKIPQELATFKPISVIVAEKQRIL